MLKKQNLLYTLILIAVILLQNQSLLKTDNKEFIPAVNIISNAEYFPLNSKKLLLYKSNLGDIKLTVEKEEEIYTSELKSDDFVYRQKLIVREDGVYVKETYQKIKVILFINKESKFSYNELLPRFKFPITPGENWVWKGMEINDDEQNNLVVRTKVIGYEQIKIEAGDYNVIKVVTEVESSSGTKNKVTEWLAKGIGIVKSEVEIQGGGIMGVMRDILGYGKITIELSEIKAR